MSVDNQFQPVKSADRTLDVLEALADAPGERTLGELAKDLAIPKSSLHGILRTLVQRGWVRTGDSGSFTLGLRSLRVGAAYVDRDDTVTRAQPVLDAISEDLGEAVHLGRLDGPDVVYLAKRDSIHPLRLYSAIGRRLPAHATALGKAMLSTYPPSQVDAMLPASLVRLTPSTITDREALRAELDRVHHEGYAIDNEENSEGIRCFAVAITPSTAGPATDAISVSIPTFRLTGEVQKRTIALLQGVNSRMLRAS